MFKEDRLRNINRSNGHINLIMLKMSMIQLKDGEFKFYDPARDFFVAAGLGRCNSELVYY